MTDYDAAGACGHDILTLELLPLMWPLWADFDALQRLEVGFLSTVCMLLWVE